MTVIAVAGGSGGVGKTIVETLLESEFDIVILSRTVRIRESVEPCSLQYSSVSQVKQETSSRKIQHVEVNYDDVPAMVHELEQHKIHTIISAIGLVSDETSRSQLNLIEAAEKSAPTKRFIPSEYSFIQTTQ